MKNLIERIDVQNCTKAQQELFDKIIQWDLTREKKYLEKTLCIEKKYISEMEIEYKKFLFLICIYKDVFLPISEKVDDLWHSHILSTRNYDDFCNNVAGFKIHHNPTISNEENYALMPEYQENTLVLYAKHFGHPIEKFWINISEEGACCTH